MAGFDVVVYRNGAPVPGQYALDQALTAATGSNGFCWVSVRDPSPEQIQELTGVFGFHPLSVAELEAGETRKPRPRFEQYGQQALLVLRPARYLDTPETVEFGTLHLFVDSHSIVTVQHGEHPDLREILTRMEQSPRVLRLGPVAGLFAILDGVLAGYQPVLEGLENDIVEIEEELFRDEGANQDLVKRIYLLSREVIEFQRATQPLLSAVQSRLAQAETDGTGRELRRYMRSVENRLVPTVDRLESALQLLRDTLTVHMGLVNQERNDQMAEMTKLSIAQSDQAKKISAWAAIIFAPSLISGIYGMNFIHMGELHWRWGYPLAILLMLGFAGTLFWIFKKRDWL